MSSRVITLTDIHWSDIVFDYKPEIFVPSISEIIRELRIVEPGQVQPRNTGGIVWIFVHRVHDLVGNTKSDRVGRHTLQVAAPPGIVRNALYDYQQVRVHC